MLLTSAGVRNATIRAALADLMDLPFHRARVVVVMTAATATVGNHHWLMADLTRLHALGWREFNLLELGGLPRAAVVRRLRSTDVLYVEGGNSYHLARSIVDTGLVEDLRETIDQTTYVGASAGSMIFSRDFTRRLTAAYGTDDELYQLAGAQPVSPFDMFDWWLHPHADTTAAHYDLAQRLGCPVYAIDDETAIRVAHGNLEIVTNGTWTLLHPDGTIDERSSRPLSAGGSR